MSEDVRNWPMMLINHFEQMFTIRLYLTLQILEIHWTTKYVSDIHVMPDCAHMLVSTYPLGSLTELAQMSRGLQDRGIAQLSPQ